MVVMVEREKCAAVLFGNSQGSSLADGILARLGDGALQRGAAWRRSAALRAQSG